jgi:hypothetical protein
MKERTVGKIEQLTGGNTTAAIAIPGVPSTQLVDLTTKTSIVSVHNPCKNVCSLISMNKDRWQCNECRAIFSFVGIATSDGEVNGA